MISNGILSADHTNNFAAGPSDEFTILFTSRSATTLPSPPFTPTAAARTPQRGGRPATRRRTLSSTDRSTPSPSSGASRSSSNPRYVTTAQSVVVYDRNSFLSILQKHIYCTQNVTEILFNRKGNLLLLQTVIAYFLPLSVLKRGCFCCFSVLISANTMVSNRN